MCECVRSDGVMCGSVSGVFCEGVGAAGVMSKATFHTYAFNPKKLN